MTQRDEPTQSADHDPKEARTSRGARRCISRRALDVAEPQGLPGIRLPKWATASRVSPQLRPPL